MIIVYWPQNPILIIQALTPGFRVGGFGGSLARVGREPPVRFACRPEAGDCWGGTFFFAVAALFFLNPKPETLKP